MTSASEIVCALLEADLSFPDDVDPEHYIDAVADENAVGKVTYHAALTCSTFYHRTVRYASRGKKPGGPYQARRNGRTKTWATRPGQFRIPIKIGFRDYGYIDNDNADQWATIPDFAEREQALAAEKRARKTRSLIDKPVQPLPADAPPPPPDDPQQPELFNEHHARLRKLGLY